MIRNFLLTTILTCVLGYVYGQQLYMPLEFKKAYEKGTRKMDGTVSKSYWQNRSSYKLKAVVDPAKKLLKGEGTITYYNNSPDTCRFIVFHTYHDYYRNDSQRASFFADGDARPVTDGMVIDKLSINNEVRDVKTDKNIFFGGTFYNIRLKTPLPPNSSLTLAIDWHYTIPGDGFERSGAIDNTSMLIAYWYPEISVLDDIDAWDRILYDAATEFYHDYSDYEVEVQVPDNYLVWASVAPTNESDIYPDDIKAKIVNAKKSTESVSIVSEEDLKKGIKMKTNTWKYTAKNFPDFTFALSDHFIWNARSYKDNFGEYFLNSAYPADHKEFSMVLKAEAEAIKKFHTEFPVYEFPYHYFTVFNGLKGGGMEFPGMANDENMSVELMEGYIGRKVTEEEAYVATLGLTIHEMGHMFFPFLMGINEKKYAWMDEGMASYTEVFIPSGPFDFKGDNRGLGRLTLTPVMVPSYTQKNSGTNSYTIGSASYQSLSKLLGKAVFDKCMKTYMDNWKYKHPTPYDFMFTFNTTSGMDLNWFWKAWYFDWGYMDLSIENYKDNTLFVRNEGGRPLAFSIEFKFKDGTTSTEEVSPMVWKDKTVYEHKVKGEVTSIKLNTYTEALTSNNVWPK